MFIRGIVVSIVSLFIISCASTITYDLSNRKNTPNSDYTKAMDYYKLAKLTLSIQPFHDDRKTMSFLKEELFKNENNENENKTECYNWEYQYGKLNVSDSISELLANHIDTIKIFKEVYFNEKEKADLYMTGNLISFAAHANTNKDAMKAGIMQAVGIQFGIIGAVITGATTGHMQAYSYYNYEIKYSDIVVYDNKGNIVYQLPDFTSHGTKVFNPGLYSCDGFFRYINRHLENHNDLFIEKVINELPKGLNSPI